LAPAFRGFSGVLCTLPDWCHNLGMPVAEKLDPVILSLVNAPFDDEPETEEERAAVKETREFLRAGGKLMSLDDFESIVDDRVAADK
jgi:hypothetical protein